MQYEFFGGFEGGFVDVASKYRIDLVFVIYVALKK
jgi:hypothetical protein